MRLTCPRCSAQYEIADSVIPAAGREVECSACAHVWHQTGPGLPENAAKSAPVAPVPPPEPDEEDDEPAFDQPPVLNRKLDDSVLSILREEAARELSARKTDAPATAAEDHIPAMDDPETPAADPADWPVATVTVPGDAQDAPPNPAASFDEVFQATPEPVEPTASTDPAVSITTPETNSTAPRLPDAARLAATLTRPMAATEGVAAPTPPVPPAPQPQAQVPARRPKPARRNGYATGFGLAAMLALGLLAFYALAPRIQPGDSGGAISEWRQDLDRGRLWLHDRFTALRDSLTGN